MAAILKGVRVLDFGRYIAGPQCAALLGDLGADVIRVDKVGGSEDRFLAGAREGVEGTVYLSCNRNKRGITLDPTRAAGREVLHRLLSRADIVVANLPAPALRKVGLDYATVSAVRPDIILTSVNAFGATGPDADEIGFDGVGQAMSGGVAISGFPGAPVKSQVSYVDYGTALSAAFGTMAALFDRARTGRGQHVTGSLLGTALMMLNAMVLEETLGGRPRTLIGNRSAIAGPSDIVRARDGWIIVQVIGGPIFRRWAGLMGLPALADDPRYQSDLDRGLAGEALTDVMAGWCARRTVAEALAALRAARIPAGPVLSPREAAEHPQFRAAGFYHEVAYPGLDEPVTIADTPVRFSGHEGRLPTRPPTLGEHTHSVLAELGYTPEQIGALAADGSI